ncbi:peptidase [Cupriavidus sp. KB_39]|uniref:peptidase n=1 Tax=Cupriavidus sp. KB_39 TaxID=3233036 RepID=UPI003F918495
MSHTPINPATGLPMTEDGYGGVDVGGSPYGTDIHAHHNPWLSADFGRTCNGF